MSTLTGGNRFLIPALSLAVAGLAAALLAVIMMMAVPSLAFAQTSTIPGNGGIAGNDGNNNSTQAEGQTAVGTISLKQAAVDFMNDNLNATLFDAFQAAESQVQNSTAIAGQLDAVDGYLAYNITVANTDNNATYHVFVDPSNGNIVSTAVGRPVSALGLPSTFEDLNATLTDAADVAESQIQNSTAIAGSFEAKQGSPLVYGIMVADLNNGTIYRIDVDAATGNIASTSEGMPIGDLGIEGIFGQQQSSGGGVGGALATKTVATGIVGESAS